MRYDLPDVDWQTKNWTIPEQIKKIGEEYSEIAEALVLNQPGKVIAETLDVMQTCDTMLSMIMAKYGIPSLNTYFVAHNSKLKYKGYLKEVDYEEKPL